MRLARDSGHESNLAANLEISRRSGDDAVVAAPLIDTSLLLSRSGAYTAADDQQQEAAALYRAGGDRFGVTAALINLGAAAGLPSFGALRKPTSRSRP